MKKIISLICLLAMLLPLCACSAGLATEETQTKAEGTKETATEEVEETGPIVYPEGFSVGYATVDVSGTIFPMTYYGGSAVGVQDPLLLTCIALCDGENVGLIMTVDLKKMYGKVFNQSTKIIEKEFGIPAENVIISSTHSHSAPDAGEEGASGNIQWVQQYYKKVPKVVEAALRDLAVVKGAYTGKANVEHPIGFVRRYYMADGSFKTIASSNPSHDYQAHESVADPEFRTIRFERENANDVLMVNFQTHYGGEVGAGMFSADFVHDFRKEAEEKWDCNFAYFSGAGGNINFKSEIPGERYYESRRDSIVEFMGSTERAMKAEEAVTLGKIQSERNLFPGRVMHNTAEEIAKAQEVVTAGYETSKGMALMAQYGFDSHFEPAFIVTRSRLGETLEVPLTAISFGDLAFAAFPYEMFHENGKQVRDGSPFKTTFICTLSGDALGYVPSAIGYQNGGYETFNCRFAPGSGEEFANESIRLLNLCKNAG